MSELANILGRIRDKNIKAHLLKGGEPTGVHIEYYKGGAMEIRGLNDFAPFLQLEGKKVKISSNGEDWQEIDREELQIFRLLDPRILEKKLTDVKEVKEGDVSQFTGTYKIKDLDILPNELASQMAKLEMEREITFITDREGLKEMIQKDLPPLEDQITVRFML